LALVSGDGTGLMHCNKPRRYSITSLASDRRSMPRGRCRARS
jgi:hypothetical protein